MFVEAVVCLKFFIVIDCYIFWLVLMFMLVVFVIVVLLLVFDKMLWLFDFVVIEGGLVSVVFKMLVNLLFEYVSLVILLGLMFGILFVFCKFVISSEFDVMCVLGFSYMWLLCVFYMLMLVFVVVNLLIVGYF